VKVAVVVLLAGGEEALLQGASAGAGLEKRSGADVPGKWLAACPAS